MSRGWWGRSIAWERSIPRANARAPKPPSPSPASICCPLQPAATACFSSRTSPSTAGSEARARRPRDGGRCAVVRPAGAPRGNLRRSTRGSRVPAFEAAPARDAFVELDEDPAARLRRVPPPPRATLVDRAGRGFGTAAQDHRALEDHVAPRVAGEVAFMLADRLPRPGRQRALVEAHAEAKLHARLVHHRRGVAVDRLDAAFAPLVSARRGLEERAREMPLVVDHVEDRVALVA